MALSNHAGFLSGGKGASAPPPFDMLRILFYIYQAFIKALMVNNCVCENSPRFHQIVCNKKSKIKIYRGACPRTPLVCHDIPRSLPTSILLVKQNTKLVWPKMWYSIWIPQFILHCIVNDHHKSEEFCVLSFCVKIFCCLGYPQKIFDSIKSFLS